MAKTRAPNAASENAQDRDLDGGAAGKYGQTCAPSQQKAYPNQDRIRLKWHSGQLFCTLRLFRQVARKAGHFIMRTASPAGALMQKNTAASTNIPNKMMAAGRQNPK